MTTSSDQANSQSQENMTLGIALGAGAAKGISHLAIIRSLLSQGIEPHFIAGTSIGALVGACYAAGQFDEIEDWFKSLNLKKLVAFLDPKLTSRGGLADGAQFVTYMKETFGDLDFTDLDKNLTLVATDMTSGREIWLDSGSVWEAVRASMAYPGVISPVNWDGRYLLDGGLVNPVPVIACRAKGADRVIAVNLNNELLSSKRRSPKQSDDKSGKIIEQSLIGKFSGKILQTVQPLINMNGKDKIPYNTVDVLSYALNIMQDKITRSRLAGEPPDIMLTPRLGHIGMFEVDKFDEIYKEGQRVAKNVDWDEELRR